MNTQTQAGINEEIAVAGALAPVIGASSPQGATIVALAPIALSFLDAAIKLQAAGAMTTTQLAGLFASVGQGIQATHDAWAALDAKAASTTPA